MNLLSTKQCFELIKRMDMMDHIVDHSVMVSNVAFFLCHQLKKTSPHLDANLTTSAALLHDITKTRSFETKESHPETGGRLLSDLGYPEIGNIIRQHVLLDTYDHNMPVSEQEIVNYSDKRVLHDKVVSLTDRLAYIKLRYGTRTEFKSRIQTMWTNTVSLENKIFLHLDMGPGQLSDFVTEEINKNTYTS